MIKVVVISDIRLYCEGLSRILGKTDPIEVVAAENSYNHAIDKTGGIEPDIILLDMTMPDSCRLAGRVMRRFPAAKVIALAIPENEDDIVECAGAGFAGYVAREASLEDLIDTIIGAKRGEFRCPPNIAAHVFRKFHDMARSNSHREEIAREPSELLTTLTRREQQIVDLMARGLSNKLISRDLNIEVSTVKNHVHNILVKLDAKSRGGAVSMLYGIAMPIRQHGSPG